MFRMLATALAIGLLPAPAMSADPGGDLDLYFSLNLFSSIPSYAGCDDTAFNFDQLAFLT